MDEVVEGKAPTRGKGGAGGPGGGGGGEAGSSFWWWFSLNRENGGPAYHASLPLSCPSFMGYLNIIIGTLVFIFPLAVCLILLPSVRSRSWSSLLVVLLCFGTGFLLTVVYGSSSWLVGEAKVNVSVGPLKSPVQGTLGLWAGLWHVNLTYVTDAFTLNERVDWTTREDLVAAHKKALRDGWPWALVSLTAELGGEGTAWRGQLGDGLMRAGLAASCLLVSTISVWAVWVLLFTVSPHVTAQPIMFSGTVAATCSVVYAMYVNMSIPRTLTVAGTKLELNLGFAWWLTATLGLCLILVGLGQLFYDIYRPGQLATVFELDFGSPNHPLYKCSKKYSEPILAFSEAEETYCQGYPWPRLPGHFRDALVLPDEDQLVHRFESKKCCSHVSEGQQKRQTLADKQPVPREGKEESSLETQLPDRQEDMVCEGDVMTAPSVSTLREGQGHTTFSPPPDTLRRRSPEQPQEHQQQPPPTPSPSPRQQHVMPLVTVSDTAFTRTKHSFPDNHSTLLVEKHVPRTNALLRTSFAKVSIKKFSRLRSHLSKRLMYKSPLHRRSTSLPKPMLPSTARQNSEDEANAMDVEWLACEEAAHASPRDSVTRL